jgi:hypothetical protein
MYKGLTAKTPGCVAFSLPVQRRTLDLEDSSVFPIPPQASAARGGHGGRFRARAASGPRLPSCSRDGFKHGITDYPDRRVRYAMAGERFGATPGFQRQTRRRLCRQRVPDGPTLDAPDCIADQDPPNNRADAERKLCASYCFAAIPFGVAPRVAFWPSPHPRIRWTVASPGGATRAHGNTRPPPS